MDRRGLTKLLLTSAGATAVAAQPAQSPAVREPRRTPAEVAAGITPQNFDYAPGHLRRYGAVGNGSVDDTRALNSAIAVLNAGHRCLLGESGDVYLCSPLDAVTGSDVFIDGRGMTLKVKADSWRSGGDGSTHLNVGGARARMSHLVLDGNQAAFTHDPGAGRLLQFGNDSLLFDVTVKNSAGQGARSGALRALCLGCHFDDNANLGMELNTAADMKFVCCTWNGNGYGFRQSLDTNAFAAFGLAVRYRSHHLTFDGCEAALNGRDGIAIGQGSYACKLIGCTAWMNGDGGFTIHADTTGAQPAGDGESCYDLEYIGCESYDNFGSGLVAFASAYNVTIDGGRYYNNHRLAGSLPFQSSYPNGVYFAAGSRGIAVKTKAYDDRQMCTIVSVSGSGTTRSLAAKGWVAGTRNNYPKIAFYDNRNTFQGYGLIGADSTGVVRVEALPHDSVNVARIAPGWRVTQRVQHNGCFLDNDCEGCLEIDGFGFLPGPREYTGWKSVSGYFSDGQNVRVPQCTLDPANELILNPGFEASIDNWTFGTPSGGSAHHHRGARRRSAGALELKGGADTPATADGSVDEVQANFGSGTFVEASVWCHADAPGDADFQLFWDPGHATFHSSVEHPGGGWKYLSIGAFIPGGAVRLFPRLCASAGKTCYFDSVSLRVRADPYDGRGLAYPTRNLSL